MLVVVITFSLGPAYQREQHHDPLHKKIGKCPVSPNNDCTDTTGAHHSLLFYGYDKEEIRRRAESFARLNKLHITRIEDADAPLVEDKLDFSLCTGEH